MSLMTVMMLPKRISSIAAVIPTVMRSPKMAFSVSANPMGARDLRTDKIGRETVRKACEFVKM